MADAAFVVGTRPQFIKLASLIRSFDEKGVSYAIIHTGQHYDYEMDRVFFEELGLPEPAAYLGVGSGSHGYQVGRIIMGLEPAYRDAGTRIAVVPGDTNSALAAGIAAAKMGIPVAHVEAGLRSRLHYMPEELNRVLLDHLSELLFPPTSYAYANLLAEGIDITRIYPVGDVMYDNIVLFRDRIDRAWTPGCAEKGEYIYVTCHRAENTDNPAALASIVSALTRIPRETGLRIIYPVHPRTRRALEKTGLAGRLEEAEGVCLLKPVPYFTSLRLARDAAVTLTDSGGLQKESFILGTPVVTMRGTTEWVETVEYGWNIIAGSSEEAIIEGVKRFIEEKPPRINPGDLYGGGEASRRIAEAVKAFLE